MNIFEKVVEIIPGWCFGIHSVGGHNRDVYDFMRLAQSIQTGFLFQSFGVQYKKVTLIKQPEASL